MYDVAGLAGVSTATVSRVLHNSHLVRPDTRERVLAAIDELGFVPDGSAQGLSRRRKDIIGLAALERGVHETDIEEAGRLFVDEVVHAVESVLRGSGCSLLLTFGPPGEAFSRRVRSLSGKVDGLLVAEEVMAPAALRTLARRTPVVVIAGRREERELDLVAADSAAGTAALARHLMADHGYRRLSFVAGPADSPDARERLAMFTEAAHTYPGCTVGPVIRGDFSEDSGAGAARSLLARPELPRAVVCANDQMAIGALRVLTGAGLRVPADVAVAGFDDIYASRVVSPPLTTVSQPLRELGRRAARRLLTRIEDRQLTPQSDILATRLVIRSSCGCPAPPPAQPDQFPR
jgi:LacI family transcriptional regulator, galactose operon repressor